MRGGAFFSKAATIRVFRRSFGEPIYAAQHRVFRLIRLIPSPE